VVEPPDKIWAWVKAGRSFQRKVDRGIDTDTRLC